MKKILNEGNQIHNFISSSGSGTVTNYGSGSDFWLFNKLRFRFPNGSQEVTIPTVPVPQRWNVNQYLVLITYAIYKEIYLSPYVP